MSAHSSSLKYVSKKWCANKLLYKQCVLNVSRNFVCSIASKCVASFFSDFYSVHFCQIYLRFEVFCIESETHAFAWRWNSPRLAAFGCQAYLHNIINANQVCLLKWLYHSYIPWRQLIIAWRMSTPKGNLHRFLLYSKFMNVWRERERERTACE